MFYFFSALGPSTISLLVTQIHEMGAPLPLIDIYYDLSYGRKPQVLLIIDGPMDASQLLEVNTFTFLGL